MRLVRAIAGALLWILAAVVGLLGALLCVTVIGLPLGIPLLMGARRMFGAAVRFMLPSHVAHPVKEGKRSSRKEGKKVTKESGKAGKTVSGKAGKAAGKVASVTPDASDLAKKSRKTRKKAGKKARKKTKRLRKALP